MCPVLILADANATEREAHADAPVARRLLSGRRGGSARRTGAAAFNKQSVDNEHY